MSNITSITTVGGDINVKATTDEQDKVGGNINAEGTISGNKLTGNDITTNTGTIKKATINDVSGDTLNYLVGKFKELTGTKATLSDLLASNISVETLTVTKAAHFFSLIIDEIKLTMEEIEPEVAADIYETGIYLSGGGAGIRILKEKIEKELKLKVTVSDDAIHSVVNGIAIVLDDFDRYKNIIISPTMEY